MSVFTLRDVWSYPAPEQGNGSFSASSLIIGTIDNNEGAKENVIVGSDSGLLRILSSPTSSDESKGRLLAEFSLGSPILQVGVGILVGSSSDRQMAVLHPQRLSIYGFSQLGGRVEYGSEYKVTLLYEHKFKRHAFNMVLGPFGQPGTKSGTHRDFVCVQSLDGTLSFFEQEVFGFSRQLPHFLLPGPLAFVPSTSAFLTVTSSWDLQCFRYVTLAATPVDPEDSARSLKPEWMCSLGEEPIDDIHVIGHDPSIIVIVTFRLLVGFNDEGQILWSKRLDFPLGPSLAYVNSSGEPMTVLCSAAQSPTLYLFNSTTLKWAAKLHSTPVAIRRIKIEETPGGLIVLDRTGDIGVFVLGTEPSLFIAPPISARDLDYDQAEKELTTLRRIIAEAGEQGVVGGRENRVEMKVEFEGQKRIWLEDNGSEGIALLATVKLLCHVSVNEVRVTISTAYPIRCSQSSVHVGDIVGRHSFPLEFVAGSDSVPSDLECEVILFYVTDLERPHCVQKRGLRIPLFVIAKPFGEVDKEGDAKVTLTLDKPVFSLPRLYSDFDWLTEVNAYGLTFLFQSGERVSLLASTKGNTETSSKYRLQSDSLPALNLLLRDFIERLQRKYGRENGFELSLPGHDGQIPLLNEYFDEIEAHVLRRKRQLQIKDDISGRAAQLRGIQRRLLIRFRDKNPLPLTQLESLLEGSLEQILDAMNFMDKNQLEKDKTECRLAGSSRLILALALIQAGRNVDDMPSLRHAFSPPIEGLDEDMGWEEVVYSALCYLKSSESIPIPSFAQVDIVKLRKIMKNRLDTVKKGKGDEPEKLRRPSSASVSLEVATDLKGTEMSERMMSAKSRVGADKVKNHLVMPSLPETPVED